MLFHLLQEAFSPGAILKAPHTAYDLFSRDAVRISSLRNGKSEHRAPHMSARQQKNSSTSW